MWRAHWSTGEAGRCGSRSGFATKRAAQRYADGRESSARLWPGLRVEPGLSVGEWWLRWFPAQDLAPATLETYAQQYRRYVPPCFVERTLAEITGLDLVGFARGLRGHGLAPSRVTVVLSVIRDLLVDAAAEGLIPVAPAVRLRLRRTGPPGRRRGHRSGARGVRASAAARGADGADRVLCGDAVWRGVRHAQPVPAPARRSHRTRASVTARRRSLTSTLEYGLTSAPNRCSYCVNNRPTQPSKSRARHAIAFCNTKIKGLRLNINDLRARAPVALRHCSHCTSAGRRVSAPRERVPSDRLPTRDRHLWSIEDATAARTAEGF